ncbi:MAG: radical SAM protein [Acidobacteriota bacterium]
MESCSNLTISVTDACNFDCAYCPQKKGKRRLTEDRIDGFLGFLEPRLSPECEIGFYGGEPLLAFDAVRYTVNRMKAAGRRKIRYTITTNASLLGDNAITFLADHHFTVIVSFDGVAHDLNRRHGSAEAVLGKIREIRGGRRIRLETNSVFTPNTAATLCLTLQRLIQCGVPRVTYALDLLSPWSERDIAELDRQLKGVSAVLLDHYRGTGRIPVAVFQRRSEPAMFECTAGQDRFALAPDGTVWGCHMFVDFLKDRKRSPDYRRYCFGTVDRFTKDHAAVMENYACLRQDVFFTSEKQFCFMCRNPKHCSVCPATAAITTSQIGEIPPWTCRVKRIQRRAVDPFHGALEAA